MTGIITLRLESIGDDSRARLREYRRRKCDIDMKMLFRCLSLEHRGPWVAEIVGIDGAGKPIRIFLWGQKSYRTSNGVGSRGVYFYYHLEPGKIYEVQAPRTWTRVDRFFCRHTGEKMVKISAAEVAFCLR